LRIAEIRHGQRVAVKQDLRRTGGRPQVVPLDGEGVQIGAGFSAQYFGLSVGRGLRQAQSYTQRDSHPQHLRTHHLRFQTSGYHLAPQAPGSSPSNPAPRLHRCGKGLEKAAIAGFVDCKLQLISIL
jgi:hypothetical protein